MDLALLDLLVDPLSGEPLTAEWAPGAIGRTGVLRSTKGGWYPVVRGIPRMLTGELRAPLLAGLRADLHAMPPDLLPDITTPGAATTTSDAESRMVERTASSFGFEWTAWGALLPEYEAMAKHYLEPLEMLAPHDLEGRLLLDAGCGSGRQAHYAHRWGARVVGMDISQAIEVAARNVPPERSLFVQADLRHPPFRPATFDDAVSFGVLHHLPHPEAGFRTVCDLVRPGGRVSIYLYHDFEGQPVKQAGKVLFDVMRAVTTRLPHAVMKPLATVLGAYFTLTFVIPARLLRRRPGGRPVAASLPFATYAELPFRVIVNDQFDRFATPIENRYRRADVAAWLERAGLRDAVILADGGWRAAGVVP